MSNGPTGSGLLTQEAPAFCDRRTGHRESTSDETYVWMDARRRMLVEVVDKSADGIGIIIPSHQSFEFGPCVHVDFENRRREATVAHIARREDDSYRVGLEWI